MCADWEPMHDSAEKGARSPVLRNARGDWSANPMRGAGAGLAIIAVVLAWRQRFVCDDAFIAFTYARNWIEGNGLTWFGARVEGYTSFLWVAWTAIGLRLGIDPIVWSYAGGLAACAAAVWGTWRLARVVGVEPAPALAATALLVTNFSFQAFATSGLETMLQTALLVHATHRTLLFRREPSPREGSILGALIAAAVFTRPDSALPAAILGSFALQGAFMRRMHHVARGALAPAKAAAARRGGAVLIVTAMVPLAVWCGWKLAYYGDILPNTFHAKTGLERSTLGNGLRYVLRFGRAYGLWLPLLAIPPALWRRAWRAETNLLAVLIVSWCAYIVLVGGDFMEYRMMVPVLPVLCIAIVHVVASAIGQRRRRAAIVVGIVCAVLAGFSVRHSRNFSGVTEDRTLDSVPALADFYGVYPDGDWGRIGRALAAELGPVDPLIALDAVGAVPWFSRLRTVDMFGLTDAWVARNGIPAPSGFPRPGHRRQIPLAELHRRGVHFLIGHPTLVRRGVIATQLAIPELHDWVRMQLGFGHEARGDVHLVAMPVTSDRALLMWYLTPSPHLDSLIQTRGWEAATLRAAR